MRPGIGFYLVGPGSYAHVPWELGVSAIAAAGYTSIDVSASKGERLTTSDRFSTAERDRLRELASSAGLGISAIATHLGLADTIRTGKVLDLIGAIDVSRRLASSLVLVHVGTGSTPDDPAIWLRTVVEVRRAADYAADGGVSICLDALAPDFLTPSPRVVATFLDEVDRSNIGWNFDPAYAAVSGYTPDEVERYLGHWIRHVHLKDFRGRHPTVEWLVPGSGELDQVAWLAILNRTGYEGAITAEVIARPGDRPERWSLDEAARSSFASISAAVRSIWPD